VKKFTYKAANVLCAFAVLIAPIAGRACRILFYEPEKPEGLDDFISKHKGL
jgi:cyclic lactone autoinducer peptide